MLLQIIQSTPLRIWGLLAALIGLGLMQARTRAVGSLRVTLLPGAFVLLSLAGVVSAFGVNPLGIVAWAAGLAAAIGLGRRLLPHLRASWQAASNSLLVAGSWLPLGLIVGLFAIKYAAGVSLALHPTLAAEREFVVACSLAYGLFSGLFAVRGLQLRRIVRAARA